MEYLIRHGPILSRKFPSSGPTSESFLTPGDLYGSEASVWTAIATTPGISAPYWVGFF